MELQVWEKAYGENGQINWCNFLSHLREPMGPVRRALVENIFNSINKEGKGKVDVETLSKLYLIQCRLLIQEKISGGLRVEGLNKMYKIAY